VSTGLPGKLSSLAGAAPGRAAPGGPV